MLPLGALAAPGVLGNEALTSPASFAAKAERAEQAAQVAALRLHDTTVRNRIRALSPEKHDTVRSAVEETASLIDAWREGALAAVAGFRSELVSDQGSVAPALLGNLLWAATAIESVGSKVVLSFFGATLGTLGGAAAAYDQVIGPVSASISERVNNLHDDLVARADVLAFDVVDRIGLDTFAGLERPEQLVRLWRGGFAPPVNSARFIEPTRDFVLNNLQAADRDARGRLDRLLQAWQASVHQTGVDLIGPKFTWNAGDWAARTRDPVALWTGGAVPEPGLVLLRSIDDPVFVPRLRDRRAAVLLRLAIDERWPRWAPSVRGGP